MNSLFSKKKRDIDRPSGFAESPYSFLDDSNSEIENKVRKLLDNWFVRYPIEYQELLKNRFVSGDFRSAFFELYLFGIFSSENIQIKPLYDNEKRIPDFIVFPGSENDFYLEATVAADEHGLNTGRQRIKHELYDYLNRNVESIGFLIHLNILESSDNNPQFSQISEEITRWLGELSIIDNKGEINKNISTHKIVMNNGWKIGINASPLLNTTKSRKVPIIGSIFTEFELNNTVEKLKNTIEDKAEHYGLLKKPLMVAINMLTLNCEFEDIIDAVFGERFVFISKKENATLIESRKPDGAWFFGKYFKNKRISAILVTSNLNPWNISNPDILVVHHPVPYFSIPLNVIPFTQFYFNQGEIIKKEGKHPRDTLELSKNWPEGG